MAATHDLVTPGDVDVTGWGGSAINTTKRTYAVAQTLTDAQAIAGGVTNAGAVLPASATAAQKAQVAGVILDSLVADIDLSTPIKREAFRLKRGVDELQKICAQIGA